MFAGRPFPAASAHSTSLIATTTASSKASVRLFTTATTATSSRRHTEARSMPEHRHHQCVQYYRSCGGPEGSVRQPRPGTMLAYVVVRIWPGESVDGEVG